MTNRRQQRGDGRVLTRTISQEEFEAMHAKYTGDSPEEIAARRKAFEDRIANPDISQLQRTLLEIELRVCHLPTVWDRKAARPQAKRDIYRERDERRQAEREAARAQGKPMSSAHDAPARSLQNAETLAHPLYSRAKHHQWRSGLPTTFEAIRERIEEMERDGAAAPSVEEREAVRARNAETRAHPHFNRARKALQRLGLPQDVEAVRIRIEMMEREKEGGAPPTPET